MTSRKRDDKPRGSSKDDALDLFYPLHYFLCLSEGVFQVLSSPLAGGGRQSVLMNSNSR
jgi:hypothetical protein